MHQRKAIITFLVSVLFGFFVAGCKHGSDDVSLAIVMPKTDCSTVAVTAESLAQIDTSATPRANLDAEILTLQASGEFIATEDMYQRVNAELTSIHAAYSEIADLSPSPCYTKKLIVALDDASYAAAETNNYTDWDGLNQNLRVIDRIFDDATKSVSLEFDGRYNMLRVAEAYAALSGVQSASPDGSIPASYGSEDACLAVRDDKHYFIFVSIDGSLTAVNYKYYGFETDNSGNIRFLGAYDTSMQAPAPDWYTALEDCRVYLTQLIT